MSTVDLRLGDCIEIMHDIPDESIDLLPTDPPYGVGIEYDSYTDSSENWENLFLNFIPEATRIAKMVILPSCQIKRLEFIYKHYPHDWLICWYKGSPGTSAFIGFNDWEPLLVYGKTGKPMHDYFSCNNREKMGNYGHPCPKPVDWAIWLISKSTEVGDTVIDPFMGSGTTGVACVKTERNFIGMELSEQYFKSASRRIKDEQMNLRLDFN